MEEDYWRAIHQLDALNQYSGYLDTEGLNERNQVRGQYRRAIFELSHQLLESSASPEAAIQTATDTLLGILRTNPDWRDTIAQVKDDLVAQIGSDSSKSGLLRKARYYYVPILIVLCVATYVGVWRYNVVTIDRPIETVEGIKQRAQAFEKVIDYDSESGRGGLARGIVLSVIEPSADEITAAKAFIESTYAAYEAIPPADRKCNLADPMTGSVSAEAGKTYLTAVSKNLLAQPDDPSGTSERALRSAIDAVVGCGAD